ncbi:hypothetical protein KA996_08675 [bacterium]|nr:hypothetical protein [bacterium]
MSFLQLLSSINENREIKSDLPFVSKSFQIITFPAGHLDPEAKTYTEKDNTYHKLSPEILTILCQKRRIIGQLCAKEMVNLSMWHETEKKYQKICETFQSTFGKTCLEEIVNSNNNDNINILDHDKDNFIGKHLVFPNDIIHKFKKEINTDSLIKVLSIEKIALELNWNIANLYQTQGMLPFPMAEYYGLICFLSNNTFIGEVNPDSIELICKYRSGREVIQKFYRS